MSKASTGVSQVKSLSHNVHGHAEALQPTAICFGKMDKVELRVHSFLYSVLRWRQAETDLGDELRYHMEQEIESNIRAGMSPEEVKYAAQRLTGSISLY